MTDLPAPHAGRESKLAEASMNAAEFLKYKANDPDWIARRKAVSERAARREGLFTADQQPTPADLRAAAFAPKDLWEMQTRSGSYKEAIPSLKHLHGDYLAQQGRQSRAASP